MPLDALRSQGKHSAPAGVKNAECEMMTTSRLLTHTAWPCLHKFGTGWGGGTCPNAPQRQWVPTSVQVSTTLQTPFSSKLFNAIQSPSSSTKLFQPGAPTQVKKFSSNLPYDFWLFKGFLFSPAGEEDQSKIL